MKNKNGLSFEAKCWLLVIVVCVLFVGMAIIASIASLGGVIYSLNSNERGMIIAASIITAGIIIATRIISLTILKVVEHKKDGNKDDGEEKEL